MATNNISLTLSPMDMNMEKPTSIDHQSLTHENDPIISVSHSDEQHPSSSYLTLSVGDNRHFGLSDFQDPLFYEQPLHFHYNQSIPTTNESGYETGDRARLINQIKFNEYPKQKSVSSRKHRIEKRKSIHPRCKNGKNSKNKIIKAKEKKKKVSRENKNKRKNIQRLRYESKTSQALLLKRRRQQMLLKKKKTKLLKQHIASKKRSMTKRNKNKSVTSSQHARKLNKTNNRVASTISSRRSLTSRPTKTRSITQSKTETTVSNKIKHQTDISTFDPVSQSTSKSMMNTTKDSRPTRANNLCLSCVHPPLFSKSSSSTRLEQKLSKKNIPRLKLNVRKFSTSKSKQTKQRNRDSAKLNIRSTVYASFKKNVRRYRKRKSARRKIKFPRCTSKTLITIAPTNLNDTNMMKSIDINNDNIQTKTSPSLFSLRNISTNKQSLPSAVMPLATNFAQLTSKNNNMCTLKIKCPKNSSMSTTLGRKLKESIKTGMTLRSRTILINEVNGAEQKGKKY